MYQYKTKIRLYHTDSAGVLFYANLFVLAQDCFENWLEQHFSLAKLLDRDILTPVIHTEADCQLPIRLSDEIIIEMTLIKKQTTSFIFQYTFKNKVGQEAATVQTVHAVIDGKTRQSTEIPAFLQEALSTL